MAKPLTRGQKAAATRKKNLAARQAKLQAESSTTLTEDLRPVIGKVVGVRFRLHGTVYTYKLMDPSVKVGDFIVVISPNANFQGSDSGCLYAKTVRGYPTIVKVETIVADLYSDNENPHLKFACNKVDLDAHIKRLERQQQKAFLKNQIDLRTKEVIEQQALERLAALDPALSAMIEEYRKL